MIDRMEEVVLEAVRSASAEKLMTASKTIAELKQLLRNEDSSAGVRREKPYGSNQSVADQLSHARQEIERMKQVSKFSIDDSVRDPSILADKLTALETRCEVLQAERDKARQETAEYTAMYDDYIDTKNSLEKSLKKAEWELKERQDQHERQISKLTEEIGFLRAKQVAGKDQGDSKEVSILRSTLATLESRFREVKEKYVQQKHELDESAFECETLKATVDRLKTECQDSSDRETSERKHRHGLEMTIIELKKKVSELTTAYKETEEALKQSLTDMSIIKSEMNQMNESLKNERRKALSLDRELEQAKFLAERKEREHREHGIRSEEQYKLMKSEYEMLQGKLEAVSKEGHVKHNKDSKELTNLTIKVREMEAKENDLLLKIEDLQKKMTFYKDKALKRDYDSVSKNSIIEKLANLARSLHLFKEGWSTEKFIIKQEMSCISSLIIQNAETFYQQLKPSQLRNHVSIPTNSKFFSKYNSYADNPIPSDTFGLPSPDFHFKNREEDSPHSAEMIKPQSYLSFRQPSIDQPTSKKQSLVTKVDLPSDHGSRLVHLTDMCIGQFGDDSIDRQTVASDCKLDANHRLTAVKQIDTEFMSRVNARVQEKLKKVSGASTEVTTAFVTPDKSNSENIAPFSTKNITNFESREQVKPVKQAIVQKDRIDYLRIEKESEEIAKRIQALKQKDFSQFR